MQGLCSELVSQARSQGLGVTWVGSVLLSSNSPQEGGVYSPMGSPGWSASPSDGRGRAS